MRRVEERREDREGIRVCSLFSFLFFYLRTTARTHVCLLSAPTMPHVTILTRYFHLSFLSFFCLPRPPLSPSPSPHRTTTTPATLPSTKFLIRKSKALAPNCHRTSVRLWTLRMIRLLISSMKRKGERGEGKGGKRERRREGEGEERKESKRLILI